MNYMSDVMVWCLVSVCFGLMQFLTKEVRFDFDSTVGFP